MQKVTASFLYFLEAKRRRLEGISSPSSQVCSERLVLLMQVLRVSKKIAPRDIAWAEMVFATPRHPKYFLILVVKWHRH